jgi:outer membrane protein assembly factor BamB
VSKLRVLLSLAWMTLAHGQTIPAWPQFRGPGGSGIAAEPSDPPIEFGPAKRLLWKIAIPSGHSSPSIWGGRIFLTAFDKSHQKLEVLGVDRGSGKILWRRAVAAKQFEEVHSMSSLATATPATDGERVYAYFGSAGIFCFDVDGNPQWSLPLPVARIIPHGSGASLIVVGDRVILNRDEVPDSYLLAVNRRTGTVVWKQKQYLGEPERRNGSKATPVVWKDEVILHRRGEIVGYDLETGARKWWVHAETQGAGTPVVSPSMIYVATWFNRRTGLACSTA